jgi:hypothetical protein
MRPGFYNISPKGINFSTGSKFNLLTFNAFSDILITLVKAKCMSDSTFRFRQFTVHQEKCAMKVGTDAVLLGSWVDPKFSQTHS